ncbi:adaptive-response sensory-kinase SasA [Abditibacteriota bacterium]|nr:adaptive-response sensory-kinase SasA [Abditibacteriota bacterium]
MIHHADGPLRLSSLKRFDPELEREFNDLYYTRVVPSLRVVAPFMVVLLLVGLQLSKRTPAPYDIGIATPQLSFWLVVFVITFGGLYVRVWQPLLVALALTATACVLLPLPAGLSEELMAASNISGLIPTLPQQKFYFVLQFVVLLVPLAMLRLQFKWSVLLYAGVFALGFWSFAQGFPAATDEFLDIHHALLPALFALASLLLTAFLQERVTRNAFWNAYQLEMERNAERRKREQTEDKLQVLSQAIGSIVHDLGNPLAAVYLGSQTLEYFLSDDKMPDKGMIEDLNRTINDGARMLDFLRLSLIEQTRVLEGKPTPVNPQPVALRGLLESGVRFQKSYMVGTRVVYIQEGDARLCVDEMKMVTVWMNLIGNGFKYSDGDVQVRWREFRSEEGSCLLVAVTDGGMKGGGLSRANADKLFSAFGRLEEHANIEGTGLGLLSVQNIMEAHGGQVWIEGFEDGTPDSEVFSTGYEAFPSMLEGDDRTAFVVSCPLASQRPVAGMQMPEEDERLVEALLTADGRG